MEFHRKPLTVSGFALTLTWLVGSSVLAQAPAATSEVTDKRIVDCLLQGQVRKIGNNIYQAPPRPMRLPAVECDIRGGDFLTYDRASFSASLSHWLQLAKQGDISAQVYLGEIFERGLGREPDYVQAAAWYKTAADAGSPSAQISLAQLYEKGLGVEHDPAEAERLYQLAFRPTGAEVISLDPGSLGDPGARIEELEQQLARAQREAADLASQLGASQQSLTDAESSLLAREAEERLLRQQLEAAQGRIDAGSPDAAALRAAREDLDKRARELAEQEAVVARLREEVDRGRKQTAAYQQQLDRNTELEKALKDQAERYDTTTAELSRARVALATSNERLAEQQRSFEQERAAVQKLKEDLERTAGQSSANHGELQAQVVQREQMLADQAARMASMEAEIAAYDSESRNLQNELSALRRQNEGVSASQVEAQRAREEAVRLQAMLDQAHAQLAAITNNQRGGDEVTSLQTELERVRAESQRYQGRLEELENAQEAYAQLAGPAINLIEPAAFSTRGNSDIVLEDPVSQQLVVGKINAPAGLLSLTVNQQIVAVNSSDVFESVVLLKGANTPVQIVAIDSQGRRAERVFNLLREHATTEVTEERPSTQVDFGKFYALLIGNNQYESLPDLMTPKADIHALDVLLRERYGFTTTLVEDGTREQIMDSMYALLGKLTSEDNLLIYYAGHGEYVTDTDRGVWLPVDSNPQSPANWISNVEINDYLKQIRAKQIIVIADSCYSGSLTRSALISLRPGLTADEYEAHLGKMAKATARVVLTSGGLAPVLDSNGAGSQHSVFASALIDILTQNSTVLSAQDLGRTVAAKVSLAASKIGYDQEPQYAPLNHANHQGGDFFFVPKYF
jgi:hypothetical protein